MKRKRSRNAYDTKNRKRRVRKSIVNDDAKEEWLFDQPEENPLEEDDHQ